MSIKEKNKKQTASWIRRQFEKAWLEGTIPHGDISKTINDMMRSTKLELVDIAHASIYQHSMVAPEFFRRMCDSFTYNEILGSLEKGLTTEDLQFEVESASDFYALLYAYRINGYFVHCRKGLLEYLSFSPASLEHALYKILLELAKGEEKGETFVKIGLPEDYGRKIQNRHNAFSRNKSFKSEMRTSTPKWYTLIKEKEFNKNVEDMKNVTVISYPFTLKEKK